MSKLEFEDWLRRKIPGYGHITVGLSGWTMLYEVLKSTSRRTLILPSFICAHASFMALKADKQLIHIDVKRENLHMDIELLKSQLLKCDPEDVVLLIDHTFGYPWQDLEEIRTSFPGLLIVEDCVRAMEPLFLDRIRLTGDYILLSMYKTVRQNSHGAVMLSKQAVQVPNGDVIKDSLRNKVSGFKAFRIPYELAKRRHPDHHRPNHNDGRMLEWQPLYGQPDTNCISRFVQCAEAVTMKAALWEEIVGELCDILTTHEQITVVECQTKQGRSLRFVSFFVSEHISKVRLLTTLHRKGIFLLGTWDQVPGFFSSLKETFPFGSEQGIYLADHVVHIPVDPFESPRQRKRLRSLLPVALNESNKY